MISASKPARSVSLKIVESSVCVTSMPSASSAAVMSGVPLSIASVCRNCVVFVKIRTCAPSCACAGAAVPTMTPTDEYDGDQPATNRATTL